ncbi:MAG: L-2-hydroxyglutarate oxidase [Proteobacteria bacterium]|jgi:L-2-hydroxyglutarate oxidase|nr:L-2-hydroxyglutarate oxidase [Pseudomonadota bacterium]MBK8957211.1 L-2-hydroxyglutarate oxidase [Pseudomonadota bacterium]
MSAAYDFVVIGAGIVGLACAHRLRAVYPDARIAVLDKEAGVAAHQSGHNSGVIHAGVYYAPGSLKARLCRAGLAATYAFCAAHDVPHRRCGKMIVATDRDELERLRALASRAADNGLSLSWLEAADIAAREPEVRGLAALYVEETGIADYPRLCQALAARLVAEGVDLEFHAEVLVIDERRDEVVIEASRGSWRAAHLVVCGGLQSDRLARLAALPVDFAVVPFRGDYYRMPAARSSLVKTLIYPVPDPALPFLGVHLTLTTDGGITLGPSAMLAFAREDYRAWAWQGRDAWQALGFPGTWRLLSRFARAGVSEILHAASRHAYLRAARRYCPSLVLSDLAEKSCGIRAQAVSRDGEMIHDFLFQTTARSVHVLNAPSPAATSAFPIAEAIVARLQTSLAA